MLAAFGLGSLLLPVRVLTIAANTNTLISTIVLLWLYRNTAKAAFNEREDVGYMWFALGFTILCAATVVNVGYGTWNYIWHVTVVSSDSRVLSCTRFSYVLAFWSFVVARFSTGDRVPPQGWRAVLTILMAALTLTGSIIWWRGEM